MSLLVKAGGIAFLGRVCDTDGNITQGVTVTRERVDIVTTILASYFWHFLSFSVFVAGGDVYLPVSIFFLLFAGLTVCFLKAG